VLRKTPSASTDFYLPFVEACTSKKIPSLHLLFWNASLFPGRLSWRKLSLVYRTIRKLSMYISPMLIQLSRVRCKDLCSFRKALKLILFLYKASCTGLYDSSASCMLVFFTFRFLLSFMETRFARTCSENPSWPAFQVSSSSSPHLSHCLPVIKGRISS